MVTTAMCLATFIYDTMVEIRIIWRFLKSSSGRDAIMGTMSTLIRHGLILVLLVVQALILHEILMNSA